MRRLRRWDKLGSEGWIWEDEKGRFRGDRGRERMDETLVKWRGRVLCLTWPVPAREIRLVLSHWPNPLAITWTQSLVVGGTHFGENPPLLPLLFDSPSPRHLLILPPTPHPLLFLNCFKSNNPLSHVALFPSGIQAALPRANDSRHYCRLDQLLFAFIWTE